MTDILALVARNGGDVEDGAELYFELHVRSLVNVTPQPVQLWPGRPGEKPRHRGARWLSPGWLEVEGPIAHGAGVAFEARIRDEAWIDVFAVRRPGRFPGAYGRLWINILPPRER